MDFIGFFSSPTPVSFRGSGATHAGIGGRKFILGKIGGGGKKNSEFGGFHPAQKIQVFPRLEGTGETRIWGSPCGEELKKQRRIGENRRISEQDGDGEEFLDQHQKNPFSCIFKELFLMPKPPTFLAFLGNFFTAKKIYFPCILRDYFCCQKKPFPCFFFREFFFFLPSGVTERPGAGLMTSRLGTSGHWLLAPAWFLTSRVTSRVKGAASQSSGRKNLGEKRGKTGKKKQGKNAGRARPAPPRSLRICWKPEIFNKSFIKHKKTCLKFSLFMAKRGLKLGISKRKKRQGESRIFRGNVGVFLLFEGFFKGVSGGFKDEKQQDGKQRNCE